jgi:hypothetical protein
MAPTVTVWGKHATISSVNRKKVPVIPQRLVDIEELIIESET